MSAWPQAVELTTLEADTLPPRAPQAGLGGAVASPLSWERRAAQSRQVRPEEAQAPGSGTARALALGAAIWAVLPCGLCGLRLPRPSGESRRRKACSGPPKAAWMLKARHQQPRLTAAPQSPIGR